MIEYKNKLVPHQFIIFGGTGDLSHRKLLPAFYNLYVQDLLPDKFNIIAIGRRDKDSKIYHQEAKNSVRKYSRKGVEEKTWSEFIKHIFYYRFDFSQETGYQELKEKLAGIEGDRVFYLAVAPDYFGLIVERLHKYQLVEKNSFQSKLVIEKPFGYNLESAIDLNEKIQSVFDEDDIYRIDHYLGKEMLQNIMVIRFANLLFEPIWNNKYIDNVQIISNETGGVGVRGGYYDNAGALRDMVQNHMLQLLTLTAMEPPGDLETESIRNEKVKVLKSLSPITIEDIEKSAVRGQYAAGRIGDLDVPGYREEERTGDVSHTETFVALRLFINNLRWTGVPFYIKTGKRLIRKYTEVIVEFKHYPHPSYLKDFSDLAPNLLVIRIQPREGVYLQFNAKEPGARQKIVPVRMDFCQNCQIGVNSPEAYERLIYDVMRGDSTLFTRWDEVEYSWRFIDKIAEAWAKREPGFPNYPAGSNGPEAADILLEQDGRKWWEKGSLII